MIETLYQIRYTAPNGTQHHTPEMPTANLQAAMGELRRDGMEVAGLDSWMADVLIISHGYGHREEPPIADISVDLRPYRDPHVDPEMRRLTGRDPGVAARVLATPGIREELEAAITQVLALQQTQPISRTVTVAVGCTGGRHRSVAGADWLAEQLGERHGQMVDGRNWDIDKPLLHRAASH